MPDTTYRIHPAIGFARVGNSPDAWYLEPTRVGGLPTEYKPDGQEVPVSQFKQDGQIKRQAARFRIYRQEGSGAPVELKLGQGLKSIKWTVHVANKKAAWYNFQELQGDVMLGADNTYERQGVPLRNAAFAGDRRTLIIDPGPRTVRKPGEHAEFDAATAPPSYTHVSFPPADLVPYPVTTLGSMEMGPGGELLVLGGFGNAGGPPANQITSFAGADGWFDDVSDGPVSAEIVTSDGRTLRLGAWVVSGAPKLAPEINNITSLADTFVDLGVRYMKLCPALWDGGFRSTYVACLERDVLPVFKAMKEYRWVANVDAMVSFATPPFDLADMSDHNRANRMALFSMLRDPGQGKGPVPPELTPQHQQLFADNGFPLMPLNSGDNSISNTLIEKFMALTPTQYFLLRQWAHGNCVSRKQDPKAGTDWSSWVNELDHACAGNVVGEPMAPGIEVTWSLRNPVVHVPKDPFRILHEAESFNGLSPSRDETLTGGGCQPGDLTKRMAIPWQADFFDCSVQVVNFSTPNTNKTISNASRIPLAPAFFAYWWPAQSPYNVYEGATTAAQQALDGGPLSEANGGLALGQNVLYHRGLNSFGDSVVGWKYLGFVLNRTQGPLREMLPFYVEQERNYEAFQVGLMGLTSDGQVYATEPTTTTTWTGVGNQTQNAFPFQWLAGN